MSTWLIYALLSALCAAFVSIFGKIGLTGLDSSAATAVRAAMAGTPLCENVPLCLMRFQRPPETPHLFMRYAFAGISSSGGREMCISVIRLRFAAIGAGRR